MVNIRCQIAMIRNIKNETLSNTLVRTPPTITSISVTGQKFAYDLWINRLQILWALFHAVSFKGFVHFCLNGKLCDILQISKCIAAWSQTHFRICFNRLIIITGLCRYLKLKIRLFQSTFSQWPFHFGFFSHISWLESNFNSWEIFSFIYCNIQQRL